MNLFNVGDQLALNFVHKRLLGAAKSFVTSGFNPLAAAGGFLRPPEAPPVRRPAPRTLTARPSATSAAEKEAGRRAKLDFAPSRSLVQVPCIPPFFRNSETGKCELDLIPGPGGGGTGPQRDIMGGRQPVGGPVGEAVMGRYGAGLVPGSRMIDRAICLRGMQLGNDGLCYNKGQIKNSERMWPRGRRPLLTGGDMRAISIASRAANRLTRTAVRLQEIGLIKKPVTRKPRKKSAH